MIVNAYGKRAVIVFTVIACISVCGITTLQSDDDNKPKGESKYGTPAPEYKPKSKRDLRKSLTQVQYYVTQQAGTEKAFTGEYWNNKKSGTYVCVVCKLPVFDSTTKYKSGTGWPSFWKPISDKNVGTKTDWKMFYPRTEVHCKRCKAHMGHVFKDGPQPTGLRYCMNSAALSFEERKDEDGKSEK